MASSGRPHHQHAFPLCGLFSRPNLHPVEGLAPDRERDDRPLAWRGASAPLPDPRAGVAGLLWAVGRCLHDAGRQRAVARVRGGRGRRPACPPGSQDFTLRCLPRTALWLERIKRRAGRMGPADADAVTWKRLHLPRWRDESVANKCERSRDSEPCPGYVPSGPGEQAAPQRPKHREKKRSPTRERREAPRNPSPAVRSARSVARTNGVWPGPGAGRCRWVGSSLA